MCVTDLSPVLNHFRVVLYSTGLCLSGFMLAGKAEGTEPLCFNFYDVHIGHFFYNVNTVSVRSLYPDLSPN